MFEAHFRLPSSTQYAYSELRITAETAGDLTAELANVTEGLGVLLGQVEAALNAALTKGEHGQPASAEAVVAPAPVSQQDARPAPPWAAPKDVEAKPKPWEKPALPAAPAPPAPATEEYTGPRVKLPFLDGKDPEMAQYISPRQDAIKAFYTQFKNSFAWNKDEKCYRFHHNPDAAALAALNEFNAEWGGEIQ